MVKYILDFSVIRGSSLGKGIRYSSFLCKSSSSVSIATGNKTFSVPNNLSIASGARIRASLVDNPVTDPTQYVEGPKVSYSSTNLVVGVDTISGNAGTTYSSWLLTQPVNLTGGTFDASMRFDPASCAGRARNPIALTINVVSATNGLLTIYLAPAQTAILAVGNYQYRVLFTPASSSDKFLVVSGTISVSDS